MDILSPRAWLPREGSRIPAGFLARQANQTRGNDGLRGIENHHYQKFSLTKSLELRPNLSMPRAYWRIAARMSTLAAPHTPRTEQHPVASQAQGEHLIRAVESSVRRIPVSPE
jgi:hypothetical protein